MLDEDEVTLPVRGVFLVYIDLTLTHTKERMYLNGWDSPVPFFELPLQARRCMGIWPELLQASPFTSLPIPCVRVL